MFGDNSGTGKGVMGYNSGTGNAGYFQINNTGNTNNTLHAETNGNGNAVYATTTGIGNALYGTTGGSGSGVRGRHTGGGYGVHGESVTGPGIYGKSTGGASDGVQGESTSGSGVHGTSSSGSGVYGTSSSGAGVYGTSSSYGVKGSGQSSGVRGVNATWTTNLGFLGAGTAGVWGETTYASNYGVFGFNRGSGRGVYGRSESGYGVYGFNFNSGNYGYIGSNAYAGYFSGNVVITGSLTKGSGTFVQPHARDASKEIRYAFFEGPEHAVFLRGKAKLKDGSAVIELPEHFRVVAAEEGVRVQVTPHSADTYGLAVVERSRERIVVKEFKNGRGNFTFDYFITAIRKGFEAHKPVVANTHFKPEADETAEDFEKRYSRDDMTTRAIRSMLISNDILTEEGKLNMVKVQALGWTVAEKDKATDERVCETRQVARKTGEL